MHFEVLSLFPSYIQGPLEHSILKRAIERGLIRVSTTDMREYTLDPHRRVDDRPYGGGPGMVMMPEPVVHAIRDKKTAQSKVVYLSPQGRRLSPQMAKELANETHLILVCGHYEGIDQRALDAEVDYEVSIGDYVLTNGCLAALVVIDVVSRYIPDVLGDSEAASNDSFESLLLDFPHYTKPHIFEDIEVPPVLRSGDHRKIEAWREQKAVEATWEKRPDLMADMLFSLPDKEKGKRGRNLLAHIALPSRNIGVCCRFYEKLFGRKPDLSMEHPLHYQWNLFHETEGSSSGIALSLYEMDIENPAPPFNAALELVLEKKRLLSFLQWLFSRVKDKTSFLLNKELSPDSIESFLLQNGGITLKDPCGRIIRALVAREE